MKDANKILKQRTRLHFIFVWLLRIILFIRFSDRLSVTSLISHLRRYDTVTSYISPSNTEHTSVGNGTIAGDYGNVRSRCCVILHTVERQRTASIG